MIPGQKARAYLRSVDPGLARPTSRATRTAISGPASLALILVLASLLLVRHADSRAEAAELGFGYPVHYVLVDRSWQRGADPGPQGPFSARFNPWEDPFDLRLWAFVLSWGIVTAVLWTPLWLARRRWT